MTHMKDATPWEIWEHVRLRPEPPGQRNGPAGILSRVLGNVTDYERILVQAMEITHLRRRA